MGFVFSDYFKIFEGMFELVGVLWLGLVMRLRGLLGRLLRKLFGDVFYYLF